MAATAGTLRPGCAQPEVSLLADMDDHSKGGKRLEVTACEDEKEDTTMEEDQHLLFVDLSFGKLGDDLEGRDEQEASWITFEIGGNWLPCKSYNFPVDIS